MLAFLGLNLNQGFFYFRAYTVPFYVVVVVQSTSRSLATSGSLTGLVSTIPHRVRMCSHIPLAMVLAIIPCIYTAPISLFQSVSPVLPSLSTCCSASFATHSQTLSAHPIRNATPEFAYISSRLLSVCIQYLLLAWYLPAPVVFRSSFWLSVSVAYLIIPTRFRAGFSLERCSVPRTTSKRRDPWAGRVWISDGTLKARSEEGVYVE